MKTTKETPPNLTTRATPTPKPRPRKLLTTDELKIAETNLKHKYHHIITGTLTNATKGDPIPNYTPQEIIKYNHKRSITIKCTHPGCTTTRRIATSDLAQVKLCTNCTRLARNQRKQQRRATTKAK